VVQGFDVVEVKGNKVERVLYLISWFGRGFSTLLSTLIDFDRSFKRLLLRKKSI